AIKIIQPSKAIPVKIPLLAITHKRAVNEQVHDVSPTKQLDRSVQPITITIPIIFPPQVISTTSNQNVISNILEDNDIYRKDRINRPTIAAANQILSPAAFVPVCTQKTKDLLNMGNSCFFNVVMQLLAPTDLLLTFRLVQCKFEK
ncbi:unnamed protein product, partial [Didymodactylos carnosus]